ncbi:SDR family oxidoreductase [Acinetobacter pittii]|uniref:SDR family oxidoreductase n=1 Tax=Acinetobacter pittii TaxID=48296 RepID=UPI00070971F3|nr:SDR family oxidoreductase [Acinetobacter pittii]KRI59981.1 2,3-dihydro-2,3-dihydroxybenzoate dehydrogenase [Acinetobacter pittii]MBN6528482.1 SDR family oxidoreductase [Acinetobacter pittii]MEB6669034.1 SDR family oxidoreductase [Acinetobacter pittii]OCY37360.1 2,3-dihydro-2,3-dihydroxybenzoate dehydrogenase [Acinetobacter pittii]WPP90218.1 SDR family oxidoreductase [Acinetobacter pittii]
MRSTIVVTGAARGIGAAIAKQLLDQGYHVIGIDRQENPKQWDISKTITPDQTSQWQGISQDITHQQETQTLISELLERYEITGLVNAAGVLIMRSMLEAKTEDWETLFAVNVMAPIAISQQVAKHFCAKRRGSIVTISSNSARMPRMQLGMYATTKAALSHFCRNLALEIAPYQVRLNIVSPGSTLTQMQQQLWTDNTPPPAVIDGDLSQYRTGIPLRKLAQPDDIANTVIFLLSDQATQITMQEIVVDGGATLGV